MQITKLGGLQCYFRSSGRILEKHKGQILDEKLISTIDTEMYSLYGDLKEARERCNSEIEYSVLENMLLRDHELFFHILEGSTLQELYNNTKPFLQDCVHVMVNHKLCDLNIYPDILLVKNEKAVIIELDSFLHHSSQKEITLDKVRERKIQALGIPVYRFSGGEIHANVNKVVDEIFDIIKKELE
jgi:Protein of unknown function (DUF559)